MAYTKPQVIAQNNTSGSYAAGCPAKSTGAGYCKQCERTRQIAFLVMVGKAPPCKTMWAELFWRSYMDINVGINECGENKYPCVIKIENNSVRVLYNGMDLMAKTSLDESILPEELIFGDVEKRLEELARQWIGSYLDRAVKKIEKR